MKRLIVILFVLAGLNSTAQIGEIFPSVSGTTLTKKALNIPGDIQGKYSLVGLAYSKKSDEDLQTWFQPTYAVFLDPQALFTYDVNLYFIPMVGGVNQIAAESVEKQLKAGIDTKLHENVLFFKGNLSDYKKTLKLEEKDKPYFFILDEKGKIVYATSGEYTHKKMADIEDQLAQFLK